LKQKGFKHVIVLGQHFQILEPIQIDELAGKARRIQNYVRSVHAEGTDDCSPTNDQR